MMWFALVILGCGGTETLDVPADPPAARVVAPQPAAGSAAESKALARANAAADVFGRELKDTLRGELQHGGPPSAIGVCQKDAPALAAQLAASEGVQIGRSSLRLRNPANAGPAWVTAWLNDQGERRAEGVESVSVVVNGPDGQLARVLRPLEVEAPCLLCHGAPDTLASEVVAALAERYPQDQATGYSLGDLRGALWVETPVAVVEPAAEDG
jgi:hypothetical protein